MSNLDISFLLGKTASFQHRPIIHLFPFAPDKNEYGPEEEIQGTVVGGYLKVLNKDGANTIQLLISCKGGIHTKSPGSVTMITEQEKSVA